MNKGGPQAVATRVAAFLEDNSAEIISRLVATYRNNPGYVAMDSGTYMSDLLPVASANGRLLTRRLRGLEPDPRDVSVISESAVRRFAQGVPESEVTRAYRLWSMSIWTEITEAARSLRGVDPEDLVALAAIVFEHNEHAGGLATDAYEAEQRGIWVQAPPLRGVSVDRLLRESPDEELIEDLEARWAGSKTELPSLLLVTVRENDAPIAQRNNAVREVIASWRASSQDQTLVGVNGRVAILLGIIPDPQSWVPDVVSTDADCVAMALAPSLPGLREAFVHYGELREVLDVALQLRPRSKPVQWQDTLLGSLVRSCPAAVQTRLKSCQRILSDYELRHSTPLRETLDVFLTNELSVSATAQQLFCHANTVRYRLLRIAELTGLNVTVELDRIILRLALTLDALRTRRTPTAALQ
jgi:hypothetical protein